MNTPLPQNNGVPAPTISPQQGLSGSTSNATGLQPIPSLQGGASLMQPVAPNPITPATPIAPASQPQTQLPSGLDQGVVNLAKAIRSTETTLDGNFTAPGASGEYGAYQFMPSTWQGLAPKYGVNTPLQQSTPQEQNAVAYNYILDLKNQGYNPAQIASIWNSGKANPTQNAGVNSKGVSYDTPAYVDKVYNIYNQLKASTVPTTVDQQNAPEAPPTYGATFTASPYDNPFVAGLKSLGNIPSSAYGMGAGLVNMALHPIDTATNIGRGVIGGVENLTGENTGVPDQNQQVANAIGKAIVQRYGSLEALQNTATNDPIGLGSDIVGILAGGAGLIGKTSELGNIASDVAGVVTRPITGVASKVADTALGGAKADVIGASARAGIDLPAGAYTDNSLIRSLQAFSATGSGEAKITQMIDNVTQKMGDFANKLIESTGGVNDISLAGEKIAQAVTDYTKNFKSAYEEAWKPISQEIGKEAPVNISNTVGTLKGLISDYTARGLNSDVNYFQKKLSAVLGKTSSGALDINTLKQIRSDIDTHINWKGLPLQGVPLEKLDLMKVRSALEGDLKNSIGVLGGKQMLSSYTEMNKAFSKGISDIGNSYIGKIRKEASNGNYSNIVQAITNPNMPVEDIPRMLQVIGEEGANNVRSGLIKQIIEKATDIKGDFNPNSINAQIEKYNTKGIDKLAVILKPDQIQGLKDLGTISKAMGEVEKMSKGASVGLLVNLAIKFRSIGEVGLGFSGFVDLFSGNVIGAVHKFGTLFGLEAAGSILASPFGQRMLKWGATRGTEFSTEAVKQGLIVPTESGTVKSNGNNNLGNNISNRGIITEQGNTNNSSSAISKQVDTAVSQGIQPIELLAQAKKLGFNLYNARRDGWTDQQIYEYLNPPKDRLSLPAPTPQESVIPMGGQGMIGGKVDAMGNPIIPEQSKLQVIPATKNPVSVNPNTGKFQTSYTGK